MQHCRAGLWRVLLLTRGGRVIGFDCALSLVEESLTIVDRVASFRFLFCFAMDESKVSISLWRTPSLVPNQPALQ